MLKLFFVSAIYLFVLNILVTAFGMWMEVHDEGMQFIRAGNFAFVAFSFFVPNMNAIVEANNEDLRKKLEEDLRKSDPPEDPPKE